MSRPRKRIWAPVVVACFLANVAPSFGATFSQQPPATNPSGTATYPFQVRSDGGGGANGGIAYQVPGGDWQRCKPTNTQFTMTNLPDGTYTVLIADDISLDYWAAMGQLYSGHTAPCDTTDPPATAITAYTFSVGTQTPPAPAPPTPAAPAPALPIATNPATVIAPSQPPASESVSAACSKARTSVTSSRRTLAHAQTAYRHRHTKLRRRRVNQAKRKLASRLASRREVCP